MRFIDEATIKIHAGHGGAGRVSFRTEAHVKRGGPNGGDGGKGGDVLFEASSTLGTLQDFRFMRLFKAENGRNGDIKDMTGRSGKDLTVKVPIGTILRDVQTDEIVADLTEDGQVWEACTGGRGGKGNAHFVSAGFQAPKIAQPGEEGTTFHLRLELKLLADAGIIGFPNAGKSTLISKISAAKPKIADYAFTTLTPNLGVVTLDQGTKNALRPFVVADIPGLVVGAHRGMGLGHKFLKHTERTRVFIHLLDGTKLLDAATDPENENGLKSAIKEIVKMYTGIRKELIHFNPELAHKPEVVVLNKSDVLSTEILNKAKAALREELYELRGEYPSSNEPFIISAATGNGIEEMIRAVAAIVHENFSHDAVKKKEELIVLPDGTTIKPGLRVEDRPTDGFSDDCTREEAYLPVTPSGLLKGTNNARFDKDMRS